MEARSLPDTKSGNRLLDSLPPSTRLRVLANAREVALRSRDVLREPGGKLRFAYFPVDCVISLVVQMRDGTGIEAATVGREGLVGVSVFLGAEDLTRTRVVCQVPGRAWRIAPDVLLREAERSRSLRSLLGAYTQALFTQIEQSVGCNRLHGVEARCARWLLQSHDRSGRDEFHLTQEFLAMMLGVRRASVTVAAGALQRAGLIRYRRGVVRVEDREGLEALACECYATVRSVYDRVAPVA